MLVFELVEDVFLFDPSEVEEHVQGRLTEWDNMLAHIPEDTL